MARRAGWVLVAMALTSARPSLAVGPGAEPGGPQAPVPPPTLEGPPDPDRLEWATFPAIAGNTDIGFQLGLMVFLAKFHPGYAPYRWRIETQGAMSFKPGPDGVDFPVHDDYLKADLPGLAGGRLRLFLEAAFRKTVTQGFFGIGNAAGPHDASEDPAASPVFPRASRPNQYVLGEPMVRAAARVALGRDFFFLGGLKLAWEMPEAYPGSRLALDHRQVAGLQDHAQLELQAGFLYDSRDHETVPTTGFLAQLSGRAAPGLGTDLHFGGLHANLRAYVPLRGEWCVLAVRAMADLLFGNVPFYELGRGGDFQPHDMPGGRDGIRGVPNGRVHGKVKVVANVELRSFFWRFRLFGEHLRLGAAAFADAGRVWTGYHADPRDGTGLGLHYGVGGGLRLQWGETVLIRGDVAWSPEAKDGGNPVGVYFDAGMAF